MDFADLGKEKPICYTGSMLGFRLHLKKLSDGRLQFSIPLGYRLLLLGIGLLILLSLLLTTSPQRPAEFLRGNVIPLIICAVCFLAAAYHEHWTFDRPNGRVLFRSGLFTLERRRSYRISEFDRVEVSLFVRGAMSGASPAGAPSKRGLAFRPVITLSLQTKSGQAFRLENYRNAHRPRVQSTARTIAHYCGISYRDGTEGGFQLTEGKG